MDCLGRRPRRQAEGEAVDQPAARKQGVHEIGRERLAAARLLLEHEHVARLGRPGGDRLDNASLHRPWRRCMAVGVEREGARDGGLFGLRRIRSKPDEAGRKKSRGDGRGAIEDLVALRAEGKPSGVGPDPVGEVDHAHEPMEGGSPTTHIREGGQRRWCPAGRECRDEAAYEIQWIVLISREWAKAVCEAAERDQLGSGARLAVVAEHRSHQRSVGGIFDVSERQETNPQVGQCRTPFVKEKGTGLVCVVSPLELLRLGQRHRPVFAALKGPRSLAEVVKADEAYQ